jgi:transposase
LDRGRELEGARQVSSTTQRHSISRSLLTTWRRQFRVQVPGEAEAGLEFVPAVVVPEASGRPIAVSSSSRMEIVTANGRRIIVDAG